MFNAERHEDYFEEGPANLTAAVIMNGLTKVSIQTRNSDKICYYLYMLLYMR